MHSQHRLENTLSVAYFHYIDGYICLNKWEHEAAGEIVRALSEKGWETPAGRDIRAVVAHETAHFLDMTTTLWGLEFQYRKNMLHNAVVEGERGGIEERLRVFMLSYSEIATHKALYVPSRRAQLSPRMVHRHGLVYDEIFGALIRIQYVDGDEVVVDAPLSILSILEGRAYASEIVQRISDLSMMESAMDRAFEIALYEKEVMDSLCDANYIEYTLFLRLTKDHFRWLTVLQLAHFVAAIARFALDLPALAFVAIAPHIYASFRNTQVGSVIALDLHRSGSRAVIAFKTMLFMHGWLEHLDEGQAEARKTQIKSQPGEAINDFWGEISASYKETSIWNEFEDMLPKIPATADFHDGAVMRMTAVANRRVLAGTLAGAIPLEHLSLPDMLLGDDMPLSPPNRVDVDILGSLRRNEKTLCKISTLVRDATPLKFY